MPATIRVMSWNIQKKATNAAYIAALMQRHQIDIATLLEVPNGTAAAMLTAIIVELNNLGGGGYHTGDWLFTAVNVGDEAVGYIWHENAGPPAANAFRADVRANAAPGAAAATLNGPVTRNAAGAMIYFPKTGTSWNQVGNANRGRRPAFHGFVTKDLAAVRRFTVLNLHTPFNTATSIQSYSAAVYATAREITAVDRTDLRAYAQTGAVGLAAALLLAIPAFPAPYNANAANIVAAAVDAAVNAFNTTENDLATIMGEAGRAAVASGINVLAPAAQIGTLAAEAALDALAAAAAGAAATLAATVRLPNAPGGLGTVAAVQARAIADAVHQGGQYGQPAVRTAARIRTAMRLEAMRMVGAALNVFTFPAAPPDAVNSAIVAGDFNVDLPDATVYKASQQIALGGMGANAYTRLTALVGAPTNTERSTRIGPTAFEQQFVYTYNPVPGLQSINPGAAATYCPLTMAPPVTTPTNFVGWPSWVAGLQGLANAQHLAFAPIVNNYGPVISGAFDQEVIDDTSYYRANCYDNIFVRNAVVTQSGLLDTMSELGSWPARGAAFPTPLPALVPNPWVAAAGAAPPLGVVGPLNALAQIDLAPMIVPIQFSYGNGAVTYDLAPTLDNALQAAVFHDRYLSDHLPVFVEVQL